MVWMGVTKILVIKNYCYICSAEELAMPGPMTANKGLSQCVVLCYFTIVMLVGLSFISGVERSEWQPPRGRLLARCALPKLVRSANVAARQSAALWVCPRLRVGQNPTINTNTPPVWILLINRYFHFTYNQYIQLSTRAGWLQMWKAQSAGLDQPRRCFLKPSYAFGVCVQKFRSLGKGALSLVLHCK